MNKSTTERRPVEELDDIFDFGYKERYDPYKWNSHIEALKLKMEKLKRKKHGVSKQKIIQEKNGVTKITARYDGNGDLEIMLVAPFNDYTFEERLELVWALQKLEPNTVIGYAAISTKLPSFSLTEECHADNDKVRNWHDYPAPVKWISLWFNTPKSSPYVKGDPFSGFDGRKKIRFEER